jgi:hypothetical protein
MEVKFNVDEKSGKITQMTFSGDGMNMDALQRAMSAILQKNIAGDGQDQSVMAKDISDLSADKPTIKERLRLFIKFEFTNDWFTTLRVKSSYERQYGEEIKISTVSTYLTRLYNEGFLERRGNRVEREYHVINAGAEDKIVERATQRPGPLAEPNFK